MTVWGITGRIVAGIVAMFLLPIVLVVVFYFLLAIAGTLAHMFGVDCGTRCMVAGLRSYDIECQLRPWHRGWHYSLQDGSVYGWSELRTGGYSVSEDAYRCTLRNSFSSSVYRSD